MADCGDETCCSGPPPGSSTLYKGEEVKQPFHSQIFKHKVLWEILLKNDKYHERKKTIDYISFIYNTNTRKENMANRHLLK